MEGHAAGGLHISPDSSQMDLELLYACIVLVLHSCLSQFSLGSKMSERE